MRKLHVILIGAGLGLKEAMDAIHKAHEDKATVVIVEDKKTFQELPQTEPIKIVMPERLVEPIFFKREKFEKTGKPIDLISKKRKF